MKRNLVRLRNSDWTGRYTVRDAKVITNFIYNYSYLLACMRSLECYIGDLIHPGVIRFATNYITLQSMLDRKNEIKYMFNSQQWYRYHKSKNLIGRRVNSIINNVHFLEDCRKVVDGMKSVSKVLRLVDGDNKPTMGFLYEVMQLMKNDSIQII